MVRFLASASAVGLLALSTASHAQDGSFVSDTRSAEEFPPAFCAADRSTQHIFVLPVDAFTDGGTIDCDHGASTMRVSTPGDDPGHAVYNIDPPPGVADAFDCDGKADEGMSLVALNCLPANLESADHN